MNKHVLALSTALSILAFSPAFAQESTPAVDCTQPANANDPACANQQNNNATQTQGQSGSATTDQNAQSGTTTTTTDQNAQSGTTTTTDPNATQTGQSGTTTTTTEQSTTQTGQTGTEATDTGTGSTVTTTTTSGSSTQQMGAGELIVPADQLNGVQVMSANDYIGKTVYDQAGNNIGEVNDLIVSGDGNIEAVILGVGGFLGIGEKDVAVNTAAIQMVQDGDNTRLVVQATKEALENAPTYDRDNRRYAEQPNGGTATTTDQTGSTTTAPADSNAGAAGNAGAVDCSLPENANNAACANQQQNQSQ